MDITTINKPVVTAPDFELIGIIGVTLVTLVSLGLLIKFIKDEKEKESNMRIHLTVVIKQEGNKVRAGIYDQKDPSARNLNRLFRYKYNFWVERIKCGDGYVNAMFFEGDEYTRSLDFYHTNWVPLYGLLTANCSIIDIGFPIPNLANWAMLIEEHNLKITTGNPGSPYFREIKINQCLNLVTLQWEDHITPTCLIVDGIVNVFHPPHNYRPQV